MKVKLLVTMEIDKVDRKNKLTKEMLVESARLAVQNSLHYAEKIGFTHPLDEETVIHIVSVKDLQKRLDEVFEVCYSSSRK